MKKTTATSEADIQRTVTELLILDGWRHFRTDPTSDRARGKGFGEKGMCDDLYLRYTSINGGNILWIEFKAPGKIPKPHQVAWHQRERERGALVLGAVDDIDKFMAWYAESGLCRLASLIAAQKGKRGT